MEKTIKTFEFYCYICKAHVTIHAKDHKLALEAFKKQGHYDRSLVRERAEMHGIPQLADYIIKGFPKRDKRIAELMRLRAIPVPHVPLKRFKMPSG